jgi:capsid protein
LPTRHSQADCLELPSAFAQAYQDYRSDWAIGGTGPYLPSPRGVQLMGGGADYHYRDETKFFRAIERAREYDRNNMIVGQAINRLTANLVQDGFTVDPSTGDTGIDTELKDDWYNWCADPSRCDSEGERTFYDFELLTQRTIPVDGDTFCITGPDGRLQFIEAHRCRRPTRSKSKNCIHGVNLNARTARRISYFFAKEDVDPFSTLLLKDIEEVPARDAAGEKQVLHLYDANRFSQRRGVTVFAPVALPIHYHDDIQFANLVAAQVQSCYAILEQQLQGVGTGLPTPHTAPPAATGATTTEIVDDGTTRTRQGMAPGMRVRAQEGWGLTGFAPTIPGPMYREHTLLILTIIAVNLDLPVQVLLLDASQTNFSGWRGAIDQARIRYRVIQRRRIDGFYSPVWRWRVRQKLAKDAQLRAAQKRSGINLFAHTWHPPTWSYIEPEKDIKANALELATKQTSARRQRARQGEDFDDVVPEMADDAGKVVEAFERKAQELNKKLNLAKDREITRDELLRVFTAQGVTVSATEGEDKAEPALKPKAGAGTA